MEISTKDWKQIIVIHAFKLRVIKNVTVIEKPERTMIQIKKLLVNLLLLLVPPFLIAGALTFVRYRPVPLNSSQTTESSRQSRLDFTEFNGRIDGYVKLSENLLLADGTFSVNTSMSKDYLTAVSGKVANKSYSTGRYHKGDSVTLTIYETKEPYNPKKARRIDFKKALADYSDDYLYSGSEQTIVQDEKTGDPYLQLRVINKSKPMTAHAKYRSISPGDLIRHSQPLYFNLKTERFRKKLSYKTPTEWISKLGNFYSTETTNLYELTDKGSTIYISDYFVGFHSDYDNIRLFSKYAVDSDKITHSVRLYWYGEPNSKELAELLAPEGQTDIFQGVTLYGAYSKDGQDHVVQSYDELMQWYQESATDTSQSSQEN